MSEYPFQFAVLRYIHDPATQEFLNVGVVLYSREASFLRARISRRYRRLSDAFLKQVNGNHYRRVADHLERAVSRIQDRFQKELALEEMPTHIEVTLGQILSPDDSSLVFGGVGAGMTENLSDELDHLYDRLVDRYVDREDLPSRNEDDVWRVYKRQLDRAQVTPRLETDVTIHAPRYDESYVFRSAWRNERIHPLEPVSFDLVRPESIKEKAHKWLGRTVALEGTDELGILYLLVGGPQQEKLQHVYDQALLFLRNEIRLECEIVEEQDAAAFSKRLAAKMNNH